VHLSEAEDGISVAPEHAEAISGLRDAREPTEGKEEATEVITDLLSSPSGGERVCADSILAAARGRPTPLRRRA
jgi:hypothetical protein